LNNNYNIIWSRVGNFNKYLNRFKKKNNINFLEIGSFEGFSTNYFLDNFLDGDKCFITCIDPFIKYSEATENLITRVDNYINSNTYNKFLQNTMKNKERIILYKGYSQNILPQLKTKFHFIYIDGDHSSSAVYSDAIKSFELLLIDGIMIFDDYLWGVDKKLIIAIFGKIFINRYPKNIFERYIKELKNLLSRVYRKKYHDSLPKKAIDKFLFEYKEKIDILHINEQVVIKKIKH
tara:strand:+ start:2189 stop:2893 length:705 start_codon:yes stop_codon:yes gene_type:complete